jgi:hypothetical protein
MTYTWKSRDRDRWDGGTALRSGAFVLALAGVLCAAGARAHEEQEHLPTIQATIDTDIHRATPVPHRYIHGVIPDDAKFQMLLPDNWNGKVIIHTRGFSGTEFSTGAFEPAALAKGYAFAASDEGWNRYTIANRPQDSYYETRQRLWELTIYTHATVKEYYGSRSSRTLLVGGSNGGHSARWIVEDFPELFDGGISGYGYNSYVSQWGGVAHLLRNYDVIASRIDDIIAKRAAFPAWDPFHEPLSPPLTPDQLKALHAIYRYPQALGDGFPYDAGRWPGSEVQWKATYGANLGYLRDSMTRFDPSYHPNGYPLSDADLKQWDPTKSPTWVQRELRKLDVNGDLKRPIIAMHGAADPIVSPGETAGYMRLLEARYGPRRTRELLAVYYIPGMGHGGAQFNDLVPAQIDALEAWIDFHQSHGRRGAPAPGQIGIYPRAPGSEVEHDDHGE